MRVYRLGEVPPGLTHDEANHGWDAINILRGVWLFYFPLNYGSEPLYNYVVAGLMAAIGRHLLALRLVNVFFGVLAVAAVYRWGRGAFGRYPALAAAALMAVSFWPIATSRQGLRAGMMPFFMAGAVICYWRIVERRARSEERGAKSEERGARSEERREWSVERIYLVAGFALCVAAMLHTYLAARVVWLLFPLFLGYLVLFHRPLFRQSWRPVLAGLLLAGLLTVPMFLYLRTHPEADTRLEMLDGPLQAFRQGNWRPIVDNAAGALLAFIWPGHGDHFLAYNIPGRPVYDWITAIFFAAGVLVCLWRWRRPAYMFLLLWFGLGILPSLVTGPEANTTRNLAAMGAVYLLPAVGLYGVWGKIFLTDGKDHGREERKWGYVAAIVVIVWLVIAGGLSWRDYFGRWADAAEVRAAYQHTLVEGLAYLEKEAAVGEAAVVSSVYPGVAHDPSIARVMGQQEQFDLRWVDGRSALLFPGGMGAKLLLPSSTPLHPAFAAWVEQGLAVQLRSDDLDPAYRLAQMAAGQWPEDGEAVNFGNGLELIGSRWLANPVAAGGTAELITAWRVLDPALVGPIVPPAFTTDVIFFSHVLDGEGILTQRDALDAPSWAWRPGDVVVQLHSLGVPAGSVPGLYQTAVGVYDRASGVRLPVIGADGEAGDGRTLVVPLEIVASS